MLSHPLEHGIYARNIAVKHGVHATQRALEDHRLTRQFGGPTLGIAQFVFGVFQALHGTVKRLFLIDHAGPCVSRCLDFLLAKQGALAHHYLVLRFANALAPEVGLLRFHPCQRAFDLAFCLFKRQPESFRRHQ